MKKTLSMLLAVLMAFAAFGAAAEGVPEAGVTPAESAAEAKAPAAENPAADEKAPVFASVGDALASSGFTGIMSVEPNHLALVVRAGDRYIRVVSSLDQETFNQYIGMMLSEDYGTMQEKVKALVAALPVSYTEYLTAVPLSLEELDAAAGKTVSELEAEGFQLSEHRTDGENIVFTMTRGLFDYSFAMNATPEEFEKIAGYDELGALTVKNAIGAAGLSRNAADLDWQADGTYAAPETDADPIASFMDSLAGLWDQAEEKGGAALENGEQKLDEYLAGLEDKAEEAGKNGETRLDELLRSLGEALTEAGETSKARLDELLSSLGEALKEAGRAGEARFNELLRFLGEAMNKAGEAGEARLDELRRYLQEKKPELVNGFSSLLDSLIGLLEK